MLRCRHTLYGALVVVCLARVAYASAQRSAQVDDWGEGDDVQGFADAEADAEEDDGATAREGDATDDAGFAEVKTEEVEAHRAESDDTAGPDTDPFTLHAFHRLVLGARVQRLSDRPLAAARNAVELALAYEHGFPFGERRGKVRAYAGGRLYYDAAYLLHRDHYDEPTLELYEFGQLPREISLALTLGSFRVASGRQVVRWGQGEVLHVLDRVNPSDLLEPVLTPPGELRVPVLMTRVDLERDRHRMELVVVHEVSFGRLPPPLSEMSPLRALLLELPELESKTLRYRHEPGPSLFLIPAHQWHGRYSFRAPFADLTLDAGSMLEPLGIPVLPEPAEFAADDLDLRVIHPRFELIGASIAAPVDNLLLRAELQWSFERPVALRRSDSPLLDLRAERLDQLDGLLGITHVASAATSVGLEVRQSWLPEHPDEPFDTLWPVESTQVALRVDHALLRDRLRLGLLALLIGFDPVNTWVARAQCGYAVTDDFDVLLQFIHYQPTEHFGIFYGFREHDRVVLTTQWNLVL